MRKLVALLGLYLTIALSVTGQESYLPTANQHKGFFLSLNGGLNVMNIDDDVVDPVYGNYAVNFSGMGMLFDFKIGGAIKENVILHASMLSSSMVGPEISVSGSSVNTSNDLSIGETMIGAGVTYYFMPSNIFMSGSLGMGRFVLVDNSNEINEATDRGVSLQLKLGKEWWMSDKWGLGLALTYGMTSVKNEPGDGAEEYLKSGNFGVVFNATLN